MDTIHVYGTLIFNCVNTSEIVRGHVFRTFLKRANNLGMSTQRKYVNFVLKLTEIVIVWVYYTTPFGFSLIWQFWDITFQFMNYFVWIRVTDEG